MDNQYHTIYFNLNTIKDTQSDFLKYLQYYLQQASNRCAEKTFGLEFDSLKHDDLWESYSFDGLINDISKEHFTMVVVKAEYYESIRADLKRVVLNGDLFKNTLGHVHLTWDKNLDICALWDVCLHFKNIEPGTKGGGSILIAEVLESINDIISNSTLLWLCVDFRNNEFTKVCSLYAKFGFSDPYISKSGPFENLGSFPLGCLCLSRRNIFVDEEDIFRTKTLFQITYVVGQYIKLQIANNNPNPAVSTSVRDMTVLALTDTEKQNVQNVCNINIVFPIETVKRLYRLTAYSTYNPDLNTTTQKETSGSFYVKQNESYGVESYGVWYAKIKNTREMVGSEEMVGAIPTRYNFHTHTRDTYERENVNISFPSGLDWPGYLHQVLSGKTSLHFVITKEGIYSLQINPFWCKQMEILQQELNKIPDWYDKMKPLFQLVRTVPDGQNVIEAAKKYTEDINTKLFLGITEPIFVCVFLDWVGLFNQTSSGIYANLPVIYGQCFLSDESFEARNHFE